MIRYILENDFSTKTPDHIQQMTDSRALFAKELVKNLYENIIYREDFDIADSERASSKFAESILNAKTINQINDSTMVKLPLHISESTIKDTADKLADSISLGWFEEAKWQIVEAKRIEENFTGKDLEKHLAFKFSLFKEFNALDKIQKSDDGSLTEAVIANMDASEKLNLAIRMDAFKNSLSAIGLDITSDKISAKIQEAFDINLIH